MITSNRAVGGRTVGFFTKGKVLTPSLSSTPRTWVLSNGRATFTFVEDYTTGVRLDSWKSDSSSTTFYNKSRNLWTINVIRDYQVNSTPSSGSARVNVFHYNLYPKRKDFNTSVSSAPTYINGIRSFSFSWNRVVFDPKNPSNTCAVTVTASLKDGTDALDIKIEIDGSSIFYTNASLKNFNSACITSIQFPSIVLEKDETESVNEDFFISTPVGYGYTYYNPYKYLRTPRYLEESFQYNHLAERCYSAGFVGDPVADLQRYNYGSPGGFQIPAIVLGNRTTLDATLVYALDQEGTNPKGFQFYFDDRNLHIKTYHMSDHQVDPYGLGGYTSNTLRYSVENKPTWTLRIRPFKSPTKWVDWHGFELYRAEAVPEQESFGWMGKSLYDRYQSSEISKSAAEMPLVLNVYGYTTGALDNLTGTIAFYKDFYRKCTNPNVEGDILFPIYYTPATLNYKPNRSVDPTNKTDGAYYGWYTWAHQGTGVGKVGPELFKSPDYTGVNNFHTGAFTKISQSGDLLYSYNKFPFIISTGSTWTSLYSGIDLCVKSLGNEAVTFTNDQYKYWAYSGTPGGVFDTEFNSCFGVDIVVDKYIDISSGLSKNGIGLFHDTAGVFGRGCYAKEHKHYNPTTSTTVTKSHPRGGFSKYFNDLQVDILSEYNEVNRKAFQSAFGSVISSGDFIFKQCAEFPTDILLRDVPVSLTYEPLGPIYNFFFNDVFNPRPDAVLNTAGGVEIDSLPDFIIEAAVAAGARYWSAYIKPPNWIQRCPAFQIALSDRAIWDEWVAVHNTNAFSSFFTRGAITGVGVYGKILKAPITEEYQAMNWSSFTAQTWPYTNRVSAWHVDNQVEFFRPELSGINNDEFSAFTGIWSGYLNDFTKKILRIQAYNPDYIYHGSLQHPLDSFTTDLVDEPTESRLLRRCANPNTGDPFTVASTVDKIQHIVRKHRREDNYLIVAGNWFSGSGSFSATFDPANYGIVNGYQVYSLDLSSPSHGTKTLISAKDAGETFSFTTALGEYDYIAYEIEINNRQLDPNVFGDVKTNYAPVRYSYDVLSLLTSDVTCSYSYGTSYYDQIFTPQEGYRAPATQEIVNNLPQWMKIRQSYDSNGWKLTNSWGMGFENLIEVVKDNILNLNLSSADTTLLSSLSYVDSNFNKLLEERSLKNILFNSSFAVKDVTRTDLPAGWKEFSTTSNCYLNYTNSVFSPVSIVSDSGKLKIGQELLLDNLLINNATASMYLRADSSVVDIKLHIAVQKIDGTSISFTAKTSNRSSEWVRLVLPFVVNAQVYKINYSIVCDCTGPVYISAPQLERGSITQWSSSILDNLRFLNSSNIFNTVYALPVDSKASKIPLFAISNETTFSTIGIPTRVEKTTIPTKDIVFITENQYSRKVDNLFNIYNVNFEVFENKVVERSQGPSVFDFFGSYDIRDLRFFEELTYGTIIDSSTTLVPLAAAIRKDHLFVVCKETYNGITRSILKVTRPRTPPNGQTYLESVIDFDLNISFEDILDIDQITDQEVASIAFSDTDPSYMVIITTNNIRHYYKLYFDYYYFNSQRNRVYTIEKYKNSSLIIL